MVKNHVSLAVQIKRQMDDIIDVAYKEQEPTKLRQMKRFTILCEDRTLKSKLGDCQYSRQNKASRIRIFALSEEGYKEVLITTMHEVSHHIDHILRDRSGHDAAFYDVHKRLLFAAMDMGILLRSDVVDSKSRAQNRDKLARMMQEYVPHPVRYKQDTAQVFVRNAFRHKEQLKARGYHWNSLDTSWVREVEKEKAEEEKAALLSMGIPVESVQIVESGAVITRLRKLVRIYNFPYENRQVLKDLGYRWISAGKCWEKQIVGEEIPEEDRKAVRNQKGATYRLIP